MDELILQQGWKVVVHNKQKFIEAYGQLFPYTHPFFVHGKLYRSQENPEIRYLHFKAMHDLAWPDHKKTWHFWTERRFRAHCEGHHYIGYAGGQSTTKSYDAAKIGFLFWAANPQERKVLAASTSLEGATGRVWGYLSNLYMEAKKNIDLPFKYTGGNNPKILMEKAPGQDAYDTIHNISLISAKKGDDQRSIDNWIGRHPTDSLLIILDEGPDMPLAIINALPGLEKKSGHFQVMILGNSSSRYDLHGALCTPKDGWASVNPLKDNQWETTQNKGICLFFSCYESPAIHEPDAAKRALLSNFLVSKEDIDKKKKTWGEDSESFWRFVIGYWKSTATDETIISKEFITEGKVTENAEWSGIYPLHIVAGLDPAFSTGGDNCLLKIAYLGVDIHGNVVLDYRQLNTTFKIQINANAGSSAEIQISDAVLSILRNFNCPLSQLAIDANGAGRGLGEVMKLKANTLQNPLKIYTMRHPGLIANGKSKSFDVIPKNSYELWFAFRDFMQRGQIRGLDVVTATQLSTRLVIDKGGKPTLESKRDFKTRMGAIMPSMAHSPDEADAAALVLQSAIINFGFRPGQTREINFGKGSNILSKMVAYREDLKKDNEKVRPIESGLTTNINDLAKFRSPFG